MSGEKSLPAASGRNLLKMGNIAEAIEEYTPQFAQALPDHIPVQRFKRVVLTALNQSPELLRAERRSLFLACVRCAQDGLYPDGKEAALVVFNTRVDDGRGGEAWEKFVQYMPMISGIRKLMRNTGEVLSATAEVVYKNDHFRYIKGENPCIEHEPPPLEKERGDAVGAYAIIKLTNGETLREVMGLHEIEHVRTFSKTAKKKGSPWETSWGEMARKTVLRRCYKSAPSGSDQEYERTIRAFDRDDEERQAPPPRPTREQFRVVEAEDDEHISIATDKGYVLLLSQGQSYETGIVDDVFRILHEDMNERAQEAGEKGLDAFWEDNKVLMEQLNADGYVEQLGELTEEYNTISARRAKPAEPEIAEVRSATVAQGDGQNRGQMEASTSSPDKKASGASSPHPVDTPQDRPQATATAGPPRSSAETPDAVSPSPSSGDATPEKNLLCEKIAFGPGRGIDWKRTEAAALEKIKALTKEDYPKFRPMNNQFLAQMNISYKDGAHRLNEALSARDAEFR